MSTPRKYRFNITWDGTTNVLDPDYAGTKRTARESGYQFYRDEWNGSLVFWRENADALIAAPISTRFDVLIEWKDKDGYYQTEFEGFFTRIDFEIDEEDRKVTVKPNRTDAYTPILDNKELEVDLVAEDCPTTPIKFKRNPAVQIYFRSAGGDAAAHQEIMTIIGDNYFSSYVTDPLVTSQDLQNKYHFAQLPQMGYIPDTGLTPNVSGQYRIESIFGIGLVFRRTDGQYYITGPTNPVDIGIYDATNTKVFSTGAGKLAASPTYAEQSEEFVSVSDPNEKCRFFWAAPYARVLCNDDEFDGSPTEDIPSEDIIEDQLNYTKVAPYENDVWIQIRELTRVEPSSLPKVPAWANTTPGEYHIQFPYTPDAGVRELPLFPDKWTSISWWWVRNATADAKLTPVTQTVEIKHAFKLTDVVKTVAVKLGAQISNVSSEFFYNASNVIRAGFAEPFLIPKSNVAINDYDGPATRAVITWQNIDTYLSGYNAGWIIQGDTLRMEHVSWFERGGHYTTDQIGLDLTTSYAPNREKWSYGQLVYKYDKPNIPERQEFDWGEEVSDFFAGYPIISKNEYVSKGQTEQISLVPFISDIEYVMFRETSLEGFVMVECKEVDSEYLVTFYGFDNNGIYGEIQNGHLSLFYMADKYHRHSQPTEDLVINGQDTTASSVKRNKLQTIEHPDVGLDPLQLVTTRIGNGKARSVEKNLITGMLKIELEHDTE